MTSEIIVNTKLTWYGGIEFLDDCLFPSEWNRLLVDSNMPDYTQPILMPNLSIDRLRYQYKREIEEEIADGNFDGALTVGKSELNWVWEPKCYLDDKEVDLADLINNVEIDEIIGSLLDGAKEGSVDYPVNYHIRLDVTAKSGSLAMGDAIIETIDEPDVFVSCAYATDCKDVIFEDAADLPESAEPAVKQEIIRMILKG